jgi:cell division protein FtsB
MTTTAQETTGHDELETTETHGVEAARSRVRRRVRKGADSRERRKKVLTYGLLTVSVVLMASAVFGEKGYLANLQAGRELRAASESLRQIKAENERLTNETERLRKDPKALEDFAREHLGLIKPGETLIILRDRPPARD